MRLTTYEFRAVSVQVSIVQYKKFCVWRTQDLSHSSQTWSSIGYSGIALHQQTARIALLLAACRSGERIGRRGSRWWHFGSQPAEAPRPVGSFAAPAASVPRHLGCCPLRQKPSKRLKLPPTRMLPTSCRIPLRRRDDEMSTNLGNQPDLYVKYAHC